MPQEPQTARRGPLRRKKMPGLLHTLDEGKAVFMLGGPVSNMEGSEPWTPDREVDHLVKEFVLAAWKIRKAKLESIYHECGPIDLTKKKTRKRRPKQLSILAHFAPSPSVHTSRQLSRAQKPQTAMHSRTPLSTFSRSVLSSTTDKPTACTPRTTTDSSTHDGSLRLDLGSTQSGSHSHMTKEC